MAGLLEVGDQKGMTPARRSRPGQFDSAREEILNAGSRRRVQGNPEPSRLPLTSVIAKPGDDVSRLSKASHPARRRLGDAAKLGHHHHKDPR